MQYVHMPIRENQLIHRKGVSRTDCSVGQLFHQVLLDVQQQWTAKKIVTICL